MFISFVSVVPVDFYLFRTVMLITCSRFLFKLGRLREGWWGGGGGGGGGEGGQL